MYIGQNFVRSALCERQMFFCFCFYLKTHSQGKTFSETVNSAIKQYEAIILLRMIVKTALFFGCADLI